VAQRKSWDGVLVIVLPSPKYGPQLNVGDLGSHESCDHASGRLRTLMESLIWYKIHAEHWLSIPMSSESVSIGPSKSQQLPSVVWAMPQKQGLAIWSGQA